MIRTCKCGGTVLKYRIGIMKGERKHYFKCMKCQKEYTQRARMSKLIK